MPDRVKELWAKFVDDHLTEEECAELFTALENSPDLFHELMKNREIAGVLGQLTVNRDEFLRSFQERMRVKPGEKSDLVMAVRKRLLDESDETFPIGTVARESARANMHSVPAKSSRARQPSRHRTSSVRRVAGRQGLSLGAFVALAAGVVVVAGAWLLLRGEPIRQKRIVKQPAPMETERAGTIQVDTESTASVKTPASLPKTEISLRRRGSDASAPGAGPLNPQRDISPSSWRPAIPPVPQWKPQRDVPNRESAQPDSGAARMAPEPAPDSDKQETQPPIARIASIRGRVMYQRGHGTRWLPAQAGISLLAEDGIDTRSGMARLDLADSTVYVNRGTVIRLRRVRTDTVEVVLVELAKGEVYVDDARRKIHVETTDGLVSPVGTRFDVARKHTWTLVVVEKGVVEARAKHKRSKRGERAGSAAADQVPPLGRRNFAWVQQVVHITPGHQSRIRKGIAPTQPRPVNVDKIVAWARRIEPRQKVLLYFDFEDGQRPRAWKVGRIVKGPPWPGSRYCLGSEYNVRYRNHKVNLDLDEDRKRHIKYTKGMVLQFNCWIEQEAQPLLFVQLNNGAQGVNYAHKFSNVPRHKWIRVSVSLADIKPLMERDKGKRFGQGDLIGNVQVTVGTHNPEPKGHYLYVDDVKLISYPLGYGITTGVSDH